MTTIEKNKTQTLQKSENFAKIAVQATTPTTSNDMSNLNKIIEQYYDEIPYESHAFPDASPEHLASVATLFGLQPVAIENARVLELGCSMGGNLIPGATRNPKATYVGIDLSSNQIDVANLKAQALNLTNIKFEQKDIADITPETFGKFDYIIAHGVYSWVPENIKQAIFKLCQSCLSENGLAFISYNTYPGWKTKEVARDAMRFRAQSQEGPVKQLAHGRGMINFLEEYTAKDSLIQQMIKSEATTIRNAAAYYLSHEYLETVNEPCYFKDFIELAGKYELRYVAESEPSTMFVSNLGNDIAQALLNEANGDQITLEQYMDFVKNRQFRQTILTHQKNADKIRYRIRSEDLKTFEYTGVFTSQSIEYDQLPTTFDNGAGAKISVAQAIEKAALSTINQAFPTTLNFREILEGAQKIINSKLPVHADILASLLEQLLIRGFLSFRSQKVKVVSTVSDKPTTTALARHDADLKNAANNGSTANLRNQSVKLSLIQQHILPLMDGTKTKQDLQAHLLAKAKSNEIQFNRNGVVLTKAEDLETAAEEHLDSNLLLSAKQGLLIA